MRFLAPRGLFWLAWSLFAVGCAPSAGPWREIATPNFVLRTDLDVETAREAALALERDRDLVVSAAWGNLQIPQWSRTEVYVLADERDFHAHFGPKLGSAMVGAPRQYYLSGAPQHWESRQSLAVAGVSEVRDSLAFELASLIYPEAPPWFLSGIGLYLATVHPSDDGQSVIMGAANVSALQWYRSYRTVSVRQMLGWNREGDTTESLSHESSALGGLSWLYVDWLINNQGEAFAHYRSELMRGTAEKEAFAAAFPGFDPEATDKVLFDYQSHGQHAQVTLPLRPGKPALQERLLGPADLHVVHTRIADAAWSLGEHPITEAAHQAQRREWIDEALMLEPTNVAALGIADWRPAPEQLASVRAASKAHPDDPQIWELLARLLRDSPRSHAEEEQALRKAVALAPNNPDTLNNLAVLLLQQNHHALALPFALRALKRAPYRDYVLETYAAVMFRAGNCASAATAQQRALELMSAAQRSARPDAGKVLAEYRSGCTRRRR